MKLSARAETETNQHRLHSKRCELTLPSASMADRAQTTTKKHKQFVSEPMGDKLVTELGGIGPKYGERLREAGFEKAYNVLGQFLVLNKDEELFVDWLMTTTSATKKCATDCYNCLKDWSDAYI
ncbi:barrier-to-autointegration factor-like [Acanthaster planci]|uniref:Barrier-to-autointegration factor 1 n=1 Tax=Acanthaster planci TaxID=133434 RepID=A0A8B7YSS1_ACAPL|nr:barrier-to-autointegration factor-like [Acanthaster planci]